MPPPKPQTYDGPPTVAPESATLAIAPQQAKVKGRIVDDAELIAMNKIQRILAILAPSEAARVIAWLTAKNQPPPVAA